MGVRTTVVDYGGNPIFDAPSREEVRRTACPRCHATVQRPCFDDKGGERKANHRERVAAHVAATPPPARLTPLERLIAAMEAEGFPFRRQDPQDQVRSA